MKRSKIITLLAALMILGSCSKVPITNRKQVQLLPNSEVNSMALQQYQDVLKTNKVINGTPDALMVQRVGQKISAAAVKVMVQLKQSDRIAGYKWEYHLLDSKEVNAWCMPGGKIAVYSGLLPITKDEAGLAVVVGHEVGHAIAQHGNERMSQQLIAQMGGIALSVALSSKPQQTQDIFNAAYGVGATYGALLPFSRQQESEADKLGLVLMAAAGYDPHTAVDLWERMKQQSSGQQVPAFLSTHPSDQNRINDIKAYLPTAMKYYMK
ncbi:MAG TPA: M48 family metallopeptidase [Chitinophagales bacterium]|nr:M48 family metallopeptidase [Chitinophagales bacterium]